MRYYFSAFCSACRSVTFALQKDGSNLLDKQSFHEWYKNEQIRLGAIPTAKNKIQQMKENSSEKAVVIQPRQFGCGKGIFTYVADDFDETPPGFEEYMLS